MNVSVDSVRYCTISTKEKASLCFSGSLDLINLEQAKSSLFVTMMLIKFHIHDFALSWLPSLVFGAKSPFPLAFQSKRTLESSPSGLSSLSHVV